MRLHVLPHSEVEIAISIVVAPNQASGEAGGRAPIGIEGKSPINVTIDLVGLRGRGIMVADGQVEVAIAIHIAPG
ncbi:MAG: hypothetical protein KatS3mg057_2676 [Herpetosiphonaceae bacterium]|nr:MAG: hypothetical protein KatS3mg057_2676 [Herpetosiphonaceae bacterium]